MERSSSSSAGKPRTSNGSDRTWRRWVEGFEIDRPGRIGERDEAREQSHDHRSGGSDRRGARLRRGSRDRADPSLGSVGQGRGQFRDARQQASSLRESGVRTALPPGPRPQGPRAHREHGQADRTVSARGARGTSPGRRGAGPRIGGPGLRGRLRGRPGASGRSGVRGPGPGTRGRLVRDRGARAQ